MLYNRCKTCNTVDQTKRWTNKTSCHNCYQKEYILSNRLNRYCISCNSHESKGSWYRGPKCSKCYHNERYKLGRSKTLGQKYCHLTGAAKRKNSVCDITRDEYEEIIKKGCYYCGVNLYLYTGHSIDKIIPDLGYIKTNSLPCCGDCNTIRMNLLSVYETKKVIEFLKELRKTNDSPWLKERILSSIEEE